jgi:hypothetical protein
MMTCVFSRTAEFLCNSIDDFHAPKDQVLIVDSIYIARPCSAFNINVISAIKQIPWETVHCSAVQEIPFLIQNPTFTVKTIFNIIFSWYSCLGLSSGFLPPGSPNEILYSCYVLKATSLPPSPHTLFVRANNTRIWWEVFHYAVSSSILSLSLSLRSRYSSQFSISNAVSHNSVIYLHSDLHE